MNRSRKVALVTWAYAAMFGVPAVPVAIFLSEKGRLPSLWGKRKAGAMLNLGLLPVEAVFWIGFALPVPWLFGIARVALVSLRGRNSPSRVVRRLPRARKELARLCPAS